MCITTAQAKLSNTMVYAGEGTRDGKDVHVLAYQNNAEDRSRGPNAMVIPFPTSEAMTSANVIDTRSFKNFLKDISNASKIRTRSLGFSLNAACAGGAQVFDVGSYTVILAEKAVQIPAALQQVPDHKRPEITTQFLLGMGRLYPNQPIAVCCWNGYIEAEPLLWWYSPRDKSTLFVPTMDAHDGAPPKLDELVETDHIISVGSSNDNRVGHHHRVIYKDSIPENVIGLLPGFVYGSKMDYRIKNGDMFVSTDKLGAGSKSYKDIPRIRRAASSSEVAVESEMFGWH